MRLSLLESDQPAAVIESLAGPQLANDLEELGRARMAGVVIAMIPVGSLFGVAAPDDDVQQQPSVEKLLERR